MFFPMRLKRGSISSKTFLSPPAIMERAPSLAPLSPPETGASRTEIPFSAASREILAASLGLEVVMSMRTVPFLAPSRIPFSPR